MKNILINGNFLAGQFDTIQSAIDFANQNDEIYLEFGTYTEADITINKPLKIYSRGADDTIIKSHISITTSDVVIEQITISGDTTESGILLNSVRDCKFKSIICTGNKNGIELIDTDDCKIEDCTFSNNLNYGISLLRSDNNYFRNNVIQFNGNGIGIFNSISNRLYDNALIFNTGYGVRVVDSRATIVNQMTQSNLVGVSFERADASSLSSGFFSYNGTGVELIDTDDVLIYSVPINFTITKDLTIDADSKNNLIVHNFYHNAGVINLGTNTWFSGNHIDESDEGTIHRDSDVATVKYVNENATISGTTCPSFAPSKIGNFYIDTISNKMYFSVGSSFISDWILLKIDDDPVRLFPDSNFEAAVRISTSILTGEIHQSDLSGVTMLGSNGTGIINITGLEYFTNLIILDLTTNDIIDISPISDLSELTTVNLGINSIIDISPLTNLKKLTYLYLENNNIENILSLSGLTNLDTLYLSNNNIIDISPLSGLINLTTLLLDNNNVVNVSSLINLNISTALLINNNNIIDVSYLVDVMSGGSYLCLNVNPLNIHAYNVDIPALLANNVSVDFDDIVVEFTDTNLESAVRSAISVPVGDIHQSDLNLVTTFDAMASNIISLSGIEYWNTLTDIDLSYNGTIVDITPLENLTNVTELHLDQNSIEDISCLIGVLKGGGSALYIRGNPLSYQANFTDIPTLSAAGVAVDYDNVAPVTTCATISGVTAGDINIPITVKNFSDIGTFSLTIEYDNTVMYLQTAHQILYSQKDILVRIMMDESL